MPFQKKKEELKLMAPKSANSLAFIDEFMFALSPRQTCNPRT